MAVAAAAAPLLSIAAGRPAAAWSRAGRAPSALTLDGAPVVGETNPRYCSWNIDASYNRGFVHIDFDNANLLAGATSFAPSTIRFGGGGNDYLQYAPFSPCGPDHDGDNHVCLNTTHWNSLYTMANKSGSAFLFGVSFDMVQACADKGNYTWDPAPSVAMIKHIQQQGQQIWGYELGNEVNNRHKSCALQPAQQAAAFSAFKAELSRLYPDAASRPKLLGPDVGYLDPEMWLVQFLGNFSDLYAVTYHVYSWLARRNWNFTMPIDNAVRDGEGWYPPMVRERAPGAQIWAGEDGPASGGEDGTCGGKFRNGSSTNKSVCGTYATVVQYANDLGSRATLGFKQYQRQDLVGGRYGLMGIPHDNEQLGRADPVRLMPTFWVAFLWKRVMGGTVLNVTAADPSVRAYAHCGVPPSTFVPPAVTAAKSPMGVVLININTTEAKQVQLPRSAKYTVWTLTAADGVFGDAALLNGAPLQRSISGGSAVGAIPVDGTPIAGAVTLPPFSVTFAVTECTKAA